MVEGYLSIQGYSEHDDHLYRHLSECTSTLPRFQAGVVSALISTAEYTYHRLHRIEDVTRELSHFYWAVDKVEIERHLQHATRLSRLSIHSRIEYLVVSTEDSGLVSRSVTCSGFRSPDCSSDTDTNTSTLVDSSSTGNSSSDTDHD